MATFRDNKQALYAIFQYVLICLPIHRKAASLSQKKNITELLHNRLEAIKYKKGMFFSRSRDHSYFSEDLMIRSDH